MAASSRSAVPANLWWDLFSRARHQIDVLVYAANFLHEQRPDLNDLLREKAAGGCKVRIALGDPASEAIRERGAEERFGHGIETRCRVALLHYQPLIGVSGVEIHQHGATLYNSIYRADDELIVNAHVWGVNAYSAPVLHLRQLAAGSLFDTYVASFEAVWATSQPPHPRPRREADGQDRLPERPHRPGAERHRAGGQRRGDQRRRRDPAAAAR
jgi:hypothetical protein